MIAALSFNRPALGSGGTYPVPGSYGVSIGGERLYDAWGGVRAGQPHGFPTHRYCANLGHLADDETGLTYMRARYYEPSTGRFISEDPARDGKHWYVLCSNKPVGQSDFRGHYQEPTHHYYELNKWLGPLSSLAMMVYAARVGGPLSRQQAMIHLGFLATWFGLDLNSRSPDGDMGVVGGILMDGMVAVISASSIWHNIGDSLSPSIKARTLVGVALEYAAFLTLFMQLNQLTEQG